MIFTNAIFSALWFTTGSAPSGDIGEQIIYIQLDADVNRQSDTSFWEGLSINGLVPLASRGRVKGTVSGIPSSFSAYQTVGFANTAAQYW